MIPLPAQAESSNIQQLAMQARERLTGLVGVTVTLLNTPVQTIGGVGLERVFKNGTLLDPGAQYSIAGNVITLAVAAVGTDVFIIDYLYRS